MEEATNPNICQFQRKGFYDLSTYVCKFYSTAIINVIDDLVYDNQYESSLVYEEDYQNYPITKNNTMPWGYKCSHQKIISCFVYFNNAADVNFPQPPFEKIMHPRLLLSLIC